MATKFRSGDCRGLLLLTISIILWSQLVFATSQDPSSASQKVTTTTADIAKAYQSSESSRPYGGDFAAFLMRNRSKLSGGGGGRGGGGDGVYGIMEIAAPVVIESPDQKLLAWIRRNNLRPLLMLRKPQEWMMDETKPDEEENSIEDYNNSNNNEELLNKAIASGQTAKREGNINCKPLKQKFMELRGKIHISTL